MAVRRDGRRPRLLLTLALAWGVAGCQPAPTQEAVASGEGGWLAGTVDDKFNAVAKQLRGFDMAMVETGTLLRERLVTLRSTCNTCHEAEKVEFVRVGEPRMRPLTATPQEASR